MQASSRIIIGLAWAVIAALAAVARAGDAGEATERLFAQKVLPLLQARCFPCHGAKPDDLKGDLNLLSRAAALRGGESGDPAIVPGKPEQSLLYRAVRRDGPEMPPKENDRLSPEEVEWLRGWIAGGAPWPDQARIDQLARAPSGGWDAADGIMVATSGGLAPEWTQRKYRPENLWAYRPLDKPALALPPLASGGAARAGTESAQPADPIDAFIGDKLRTIGLEPAPRADRATLVRRATFDLLGLPPTPDEVDDFVRDPAPEDQAFARVVDRLLASPHYGEQWARHWLDAVRYADSSGFANDYERPNAWRYRDYVVRSFNDDKPYDQFVREQIAGDEIAPTDPEMLIAVGFLRMGPWELTGMEVARIARQRFLDDVTDTIGQVFLSHPLQCARCHDHKFDPIPTRDYYRLQAVFATTQIAERPAEFLPRENTGGFAERAYLLRRRQHYEQALEELERKEEAAARRWYAERGLDYVPRQTALKQGMPEDTIVPRHIGLAPQDLGMQRIAQKGLERLRWELNRYEPFACSVYSGVTPELHAAYAPLRMPPDRMKGGALEQPAILAGGDPFSPTVPVRPGVLSVTIALASSRSPRPVADAIVDAALIPDTVEGRRAALAAWIASPRNPLTARSIANRVWQWHFGRGLAGNPNNFGATGKKPTHPELLDWLAARFVESGWSFKRLHRQIMLSETYRRAASHPDIAGVRAADPGGTSYALFPPRRLTAEELRDSMLAVSGELNRQLGGIPVRSEMNPEAALQPRQVMGTFAESWQPSPLQSQRHRRSIYVRQLRGLRDPFMEVFNQPSPENPCEMRDESTVTPQVFSLFNSRNSYNRAIAFAARLLHESGMREQAIDRAFQLAYGRAARANERDACLRHWQQMTERHRTLSFARPEYPREVTREAVEENTGEKFVFSERLEFYDDFVPDQGPWDADPETRGLADVCLVLLNANEFVYVY